MERSHWVRCSVCKHEDLRLDLQDPLREPVTEHMPVIPVQAWGCRGRMIPWVWVTEQPVWLDQEAPGSVRACLKMKERRQGDLAVRVPTVEPDSLDAVPKHT